MPIDFSTSVGPFTGISKDKKRKFKENGRTFRLLLYGAYNAYGLIGPECNGIAILDEDNKEVVADELGKIGSGYNGPSQNQISLFNTMMALNWNEFVERINRTGRVRDEDWAERECEAYVD